MKDKEIETIYREICRSVQDRHLKIAFDKLTLLLDILQSGSLNDKKQELETTYKYMLQYVVNGINDPEQDKIYNQLQISILNIADNVRNEILMQNSNNYVYTQKRNGQHQLSISDDDIILELSSFQINFSLAELIKESLNNDKTALDLTKKHEKLAGQLFNYFWLTDNYHERELRLAHLIFKNTDINFADKSIMVSAITLSLMRTFDEQKFNLLLDIADCNEEEVRQRAMVGFILCAYIHNSRIQLYETLICRISLFCQEEKNSKNIQTILLQFIRSKETEKISKQMREDFMPEMAKISPFIQEKIKLNDLMKDESSLIDKNPEWQEIFDKSGITNKIQQFTELQMDGSDVFMSTFSSMKNFPFFNEICNWFLPYTSHSSITEFYKDNNEPNIINAVIKSQFLCNSDKYSLSFSLLQMPQNYKEMMMESFKSETEQLKEIQTEDTLIAKTSKGEVISNQYIQDIYRFFKLNPYKYDFLDPFKSSLRLYKTFYINEIPQKENLLRSLSEFYFRKDIYEEASEIFSDLLTEHTDNLELLQKCGYCYQRRNEYEKALSYYLKAEVIQPNSLWNLKKMAFCYRNLKQTNTALEYYLQAEKLAVDDLNLVLNIGYCQLDLKKYSEALKMFFKIEYLAPKNQKVWRPIAWCSFVTNKLEQAEKYYLKIPEEERNQHDWLNLGHVNLCMGKRKDAISMYGKSLSLLKSDFKTFSTLFNEDISFLIKNGIQEDILPIILDQTMYASSDLYVKTR